MSDADFRDLVDRHLDGLTSSEESAALSARLEADPAACDEYLRLADVHAALGSEAIPGPTPDLHPPARPDTHGTGLRSRAAFGPGLAVGVMFGVLSTSLVWAYAVPGKPNPTVESLHSLPFLDGGFESTRPEMNGVPTRPGTWSGDFSQAVGPTAGVTPYEGARMLQFLRPDNTRTPPGGGQKTAEMWQTVDLRPLRSQLGQEPFTAEISAWFAHSATNASDNSAAKVGVHIAAFAGDPSDAPKVWNERRTVALSEGFQDEQLAPGSGWFQVATRLVVSAEADYLLTQVRVTAGKDRSIAFEGCFADSVRVTRLGKPR